MCIITLFNKFKWKNWVFTLPYLPSKVQVKIKIMLSTFFKYVVFFCLFIFSHYESILVIFPEILVTKLHAYHVIKYMSQFIHVATNNRQKYLVSLPGYLFRVCSGFCQMGSKLCEAYKLKTVQQSFFHKKQVVSCAIPIPLPYCVQNVLYSKISSLLSLVTIKKMACIK